LKKLAVMTGSRSEYGVLRPFLQLAQQSTNFELHLIVSAMHLSETYGKTVREVEEDGFRISGRVETLLPENTPAASAKGLGQAVSAFAEILASLEPAMVLIEGDRVEALAAALAAGYMHIHIAHSGGGDLTRTVDNSARHAISMFAKTHFVSTELARQQLLRFGIKGEDIFVVGGLGIDALVRHEFKERREVLSDLGLPADARYILVAFHPEPEHHEKCGRWMQHILQAALSTGHYLIVTYPNSDPGSNALIATIEQFAVTNPEKVRTFVNLGQFRYLNALKQADVLLGNSSSGLYEAPTLKVPVVNVGLRQEGRLKAANIISCMYEFSEIGAALARALGEPAFRTALAETVNPYGDGHTAERMFDIIKDRIKLIQ
jgi:GDP/UDP-N,N'-diacetylbacillosamine 2-epimerase (hydrolysing)